MHIRCALMTAVISVLSLPLVSEAQKIDASSETTESLGVSSWRFIRFYDFSIVEALDGDDLVTNLYEFHKIQGNGGYLILDRFGRSQRRSLQATIVSNDMEASESDVLDALFDDMLQNETNEGGSCGALTEGIRCWLKIPAKTVPA